MGHCKVDNGEGESVKVTNLDKFLAKIGRGEMPVGAVTTFADAAVTEVVAAAGFDFVWIDGEHGIIDRKTAQDHIIAAQANGIASFYRVPACDHTEIKRIIDLAPDAVIVPMVMNEQDVAYAVSACRYTIHGGDRGCGYRRGWDYGAADTDAYLAASAHDPLVILQLEHIDAAKRLDAIFPEAEILSTLWHRNAELAADEAEVGIYLLNFRVELVIPLLCRFELIQMVGSHVTANAIKHAGPRLTIPILHRFQLLPKLQ